VLKQFSGEHAQFALLAARISVARAQQTAAANQLAYANSSAQRLSGQALLEVWRGKKQAEKKGKNEKKGGIAPALLKGPRTRARARAWRLRASD